MTFNFGVHAHGDKQKDKRIFKGLDTPAAMVVLAFNEALKPSNKELARAQLADDVTIYEGHVETKKCRRIRSSSYVV